MRRIFAPACLLVTLLAIACAGGSSSSDGADTPVATQPPAEAGTSPPAATIAPSPAPTAVSQTIELRGSEEFKAWTQQALDLIKTKAPEDYAAVLTSIRIIESVEAGSGIIVQEKRFKVGASTAYAPQYPRDQQLIWYAGTIVHDAHHSTLFSRSQPYSGKEAEVACLTVQKAALLKFETNSFFSNYVQGLIDNADNPAHQYWTQANRHW